MANKQNNPVQNDALSFENTEAAFKHQSDKELKNSYWLYKVINNNLLVNLGPSMTKFALNIGLPIGGLIKKTIFKQFCGGESIRDAQPVISKLAKSGVGTILDYSVEGEERESVFDHTAQEILKTVNKAQGASKYIPFCVFKITGIARFALLEKISAKAVLSEAEKFELSRAAARVNLICKAAFDADVKIMIDAEESWIQAAIDEFAIGEMLKYNQEKAIVFNTYQMYRHDKLAALTADILMAQQQQFHLGVKLVRGAYMEKERRRALTMGYTSPIQPDKEATDKDYNEALQLCVAHLAQVSLVAGTHNEHSCLILTELQKKNHLSESYEDIYYSQLLGMSDNLSFNLAHHGYNVAKYVPYGPVKSVMPYLFRRAEENTAIAGQSSRELMLHKKEIDRRKL